jgi:hypothetical protein
MDVTAIGCISLSGLAEAERSLINHQNKFLIYMSFCNMAADGALLNESLIKP